MKNHIKSKDKISKNTVRTEKKILGSVLLISVLCIMSASALMINDAETSDAAGKIGTTFTVDDITYKITGNDPNNMVELTKCNNPGIIGPITIDTVTDNSIEYTITSISDNAFENCTGLTSVMISDTAMSIGAYAFRGCTGLTSISVDDDSAYYSSADGVLYNKIETILMQYPAGKTGAFEIPDSVTTVDQYAVYKCTGLTSVTIPGSVTSIDHYAFHHCTGLTSIIFEGTSITKLGSGSFALGTESKPVNCNVYSSMEGEFLDDYKNECTDFTYFDKSAAPDVTDDDGDNDNTMLYAAIVVVIAIAILAAAFVLIRRKQKSS